MAEDHLVKVLLIGDASVGKTSLLRRYSEDTFSTNFIASVGIDFKMRTINLGSRVVKLQIWDSYGGERFRTIAQAYCRAAHGFVFCYDTTCRSSFERLTGWIDHITRSTSGCVSSILVGTKSDLSADRQVSYAQGKSFAKSLGIHFWETSAKLALNVDEALSTLASAVLTGLSPSPIVFSLISVSIPGSPKESLVLSLVMMGGDMFEITISMEKATVSGAVAGICQSRCLLPQHVKLTTPEGSVLNAEDALPGIPARPHKMSCVAQ